jgi:hypothetical protein
MSEFTRRETTMIDLAIITAGLARDRVAERLTGSSVTEAPRCPVRRAAVRAPRAVTDRLDPAPRYAAQT